MRRGVSDSIRVQRLILHEHSFLHRGMHGRIRVWIMVAVLGVNYLQLRLSAKHYMSIVVGLFPRLNACVVWEWFVRALGR